VCYGGSSKGPLEQDLSPTPAPLPGFSQSGSFPPPKPLTFVIGILGGIASGKSQVAQGLAGPAGWVLAADDLAHEVLASPEVSAQVREAFGAGAMGADGKPDRAQLARLVFEAADQGNARRLLESWIHPRVRARIMARLGEAQESGVPRVVLDVPLLLENDAQHGFVRLCDALVFVEVGLAERERRAQELRGWKPGELTRREAAQLPLDQKQARADHTLSNDGSPTDLAQRIQALSKILSAS